MTPRVYSSFFLLLHSFSVRLLFVVVFGVFFLSLPRLSSSRNFLEILKNKKDRKQLRTSRVGASESQTHQQLKKKKKDFRIELRARRRHRS